MHPRHAQAHTYKRGRRQTERERERERERRGGKQTFLFAPSLDKLSTVQTAFMPVKYFLLMSLSILNAVQIYMY
jgi:hypothetical protein